MLGSSLGVVRVHCRKWNLSQALFVVDIALVTGEPAGHRLLSLL